MSEIMGLLSGLLSFAFAEPQVAGPVALLLTAWVWTRRLQSVGSIAPKLGFLAALWAAIRMARDDRPDMEPWVRVAAVAFVSIGMAVWIMSVDARERIVIGGFVVLPALVAGSFRVEAWLGGAPPTWANLRRAVRRDRVRGATRETFGGLLQAGAIQVGGVTETDRRIEVSVRAPVGASTGDVADLVTEGVVGNAMNQIAQHHGVADLDITGADIAPSNVEGEATVHMARSGDLLSDIVQPPTSWPTDPNAPLLLGRRATGTDLYLPVADEFALLVGGLRGSGKSSLYAWLLAQLASRRHTALVLLDPKRMEFGVWADRASSIALGEEAVLVLLNKVYEEYVSRTRHLQRASGYTRKGVVGPGWPRIVIIVDEAAVLDPKAHKRLSEIVNVGRAVNICVSFAAQRPGADTVPTKLRDAMDMSIAFRTKNQISTEFILGDQKIPAHKIPMHLRGVAYADVAGEPAPVRFRVPYLTDGQIVAIAERTAHLRVDLGWPRIYDYLPDA